MNGHRQRHFYTRERMTKPARRSEAHEDAAGEAVNPMRSVSQKKGNRITKAALPLLIALLIMGGGAALQLSAGPGHEAATAGPGHEAAPPLLAPEEAWAAEGYDKVASAGETAKSVTIGKYGMIPVYGRDVKDGKYDILVESSSTFFHIEKAKLTVKKGKMTAAITLSSISYEYVNPGTAEEAAKAPLEDYIAPKNKDGRSTFVIPVDALDEELDCAAFSKRKKKWYDRKILFVASSLPEGALKIELPDYDRIEEALELYDQAITNSQSLLKLMSIKLMMPSNHLIFSLLLPPSIFPNSTVFCNESTLRIR